MISALNAFLFTFIYCLGILIAIYYLYDFKYSKKFLLEFLLLLVIDLSLQDSTFFYTYRELILMFVGLLIINLNHNEHIVSTLMFSFVIFFQMIFSHPFYSVLYLSNQLFIENISTQYSYFLGGLTSTLMHILISALYILGAILLKRSLDIRRKRIYSTYIHFEFFIVLMLFIVLYIQHYVVNTMIIDLPIGKQYAVAFYSLIGLGFFPFLGVFLLKRVYMQDLENELLEEELLEINNTRMLAYRYTHNINSMMLTMNILAKENDCEAMSEYLDNSSKKSL